MSWINSEIQIIDGHRISIRYLVSGGYAFEVIAIDESFMFLREEVKELDPYERITQIHVPACVTYHQGAGFYAMFKNLQEIIASPNSEVYKTYDGALYRGGTLCYIPAGKKTLKLSKDFKEFDYKALCFAPVLTQIDVDECTSNVQFKDGLLIADGWLLYSVPGQKELRLSPDVKHIAHYLRPKLLRQEAEIIVDENNLFFKWENGVLTERNKIIYIRKGTEKLVIDSRITSIDEEIPKELFQSVKTIEIAPDHPVFKLDNEILIERKTNKVVWMPYGMNKVYLPDGAIIDSKSILHFENLEELSFIRASDMLLDYLPNLTRKILFQIRGEDGRSCVTTPEVFKNIYRADRMINNKGIADIRAGEEITFLELYFAGWNQTELFKNNFRLSSFGILKYLIETDDQERFRRVLEKNELVTKRNYRRLLNLAKERDRQEICKLMEDSYDKLPEKINL